MKKTYALWAVIEPTGTIHHYSISWLRRDAIQKVSENLWGMPWDVLKSQGYQVVKVQVSYDFVRSGGAK